MKTFRKRSVPGQRSNLTLALMLWLGLLFSAWVAASDTLYAPGSSRSVEYTDIPPFLERAVGKPSVLMAFDVSGSMWVPAYPPEGNWSTKDGTDFKPNKLYYGYFDSGTLSSGGSKTPAKYRYDNANQWFVRDDAAGTWDGDFLNWLTMRRVDVARKVMIGGKVTLGGTTAAGTAIAGRAGTTEAGKTFYLLEGDVEYRASDDYTKRYTLSSAVSPIADNQQIKISKGFIEEVGGAGGTSITLGSKMEMGYVELKLENGANRQTGLSEFKTVSFMNTYTDPVVIATHLTNNGNDATVARVSDVSLVSKNFKVGMQEWDAWDGNHTTEKVFYIVAERGTHDLMLANGSKHRFTAGSVSTAKTLGRRTNNTDKDPNLAANYETVVFPTAFGQTPVVFTGVSSANMGDLHKVVGSRPYSIGTTSFRVALNEEDGADQVHVAQTIAYLAIEPGKFDLNNGVAVQVGSKTAVNNSISDINFSPEFATTPFVGAQTQTMADNRAASVRMDNAWTKSKAPVRVQGNAKSNQDHDPETVGFIAASKNAYRIRVRVEQEPRGLVQDNSSIVNFGVSVFNFDHKANSIASSIITGNSVDGQTLYPCYFYYDPAREAIRRTQAATDPNFKVVPMTLDNGTSRDYFCTPTGIGASVDKVVQVIEEYPLLWGTTPIAETLLDLGRYVKQKSGLYAGQGRENTGYRELTLGNTWDPFYDREYGRTLPCKSIYTLHFNDGAPYKDFEDYSNTTYTYSKVTSKLSVLGTSPDFVENSMTGAVGDREMVDNVAYALRADCRSDLPGIQQVISYYVFANLGADLEEADESSLPATDLRRMMEAAVLGGFIDSETDTSAAGYGVPDNWPTIKGKNGATYTNVFDYAVSKNCVVSEWDKDADCFPDNFFLATTGDEIATQIQKALNAIIARESSGGAASVVSSTVDGDGAVYLSTFVPKSQGGSGKALTWYGDVYGIFIDDAGYFREDSNANATLDTTDKYIFTCFVPVKNELRVKLQDKVDATTPAPSASDYDQNGDGETDCLGFPQNTTFARIWSASAQLAALANDKTTLQRTYTNKGNQRHITTWIDLNNNGVVDAGEYLPFTDALAETTNDYGTYFNFKDANDAYNAEQASGSDGKADNLQWLINWVRGDERVTKHATLGLRSRSSSTTVHRLGDIINGTPSVVARPAENFDIINDDKTYRDFFNAYRNRRAMVYVGGNDGLLHAFNGGYYDKHKRKFEKGYVDSDTSDGDSSHIQWDLGQEVWAYAPYNLLPHLRYLSDPSYGQNESDHLAMVDLKPRAFDAKIFNDSATGVSGLVDGQSTSHPHGWGTVLVVGMRLGGGAVTIDMDKDGVANDKDDRTFRSAYMIFDVTNPEVAPKLLAEVTDTDIGFTLNQPAVLRLDAKGTDKWYLVFDGGPDNNPGGLRHVKSTRTAKLVVYDLKKLSVADRLTLTGEVNSFAGQMLTIDSNEDGSDNYLYFGTNVFIDTNADGAADGWGGKLIRVEPDATSSPSAWAVRTVVNAARPIAQRPTFATDKNKNDWVFFGTGRFFNSFDAADNSVESMYGIREKYAITPVLTTALINTTAAEIKSGTGVITAGITALGITPGTSTVADLETLNMGTTGVGWKRDLRVKGSTGSGGHRYMSEAALLFNNLTFLSYDPDDDICSPNGIARIHAVRFTTGTTWYESAFGLTNSSAINQAYVDIGNTPAGGLSLQAGLQALREGRVVAIAQKADTSFIRVEEKNLEGGRVGETSWREF